MREMNGMTEPIRTEPTTAVSDERVPGTQPQVDESTRFVKVDRFGARWRVRKPQQAAVSAVMFGTSRYAPEQVQMDSMMRFLTRHMHEDDLAALLDRMSDPEDTDLGHGIEGMSELFQEIIRLVDVPHE